MVPELGIYAPSTVGGDAADGCAEVLANSQCGDDEALMFNRLNQLLE